MRYGDSGGVDQAERARRQQAAQMFAEGMSAVEVAGLLEVSRTSACQWRRPWVAGDVQALASKGPKLPDEQLTG
jgi:transposase